MNETIKLILSLSLSGSILALLIFLFKPFIKHKISKSVQYYLWIVVLFRLVIPYSFEENIMNHVFYGEQTAIDSQKGLQKTALPMDGMNENTTHSSSLPNVQERVTNGVYNGDVDHSRYFKDLLNQYALYIWILGVIITLAFNLAGYIRFSKYLRQTNKAATNEQNRMLNALLNGRHHVRLAQNPFISTPMLLGILRPCIIIPDVDFDENQLENILLHEISHLRRFDIAVKWLTMIAASIHWFNPFMHFIKKEMNHVCELACDEAVIKDLSPAQKQAYGDTLISVVAEHKYPIGVLQATMCEERKSLQERLTAIMKYNKKSKIIVTFSAIFLGLVIFSALYLGGGAGTGKNTPPSLYISVEGGKTKIARMGTYNWLYRGRHIQADSEHPIKFEYESDNIISATGKQQLVIGTQKLKADKKYDFAIDTISVYKDGQQIESESVEPSLLNGNIYIQAPPNPGEYIYEVVLSYKDKGTVSYGFIIRVDMLTYDLAEIAKYKTPYVGDHTKVLAIAGSLPAPENYFKQQYISMKTSEKPYSVTVYYEAALDSKYEGLWPIVTPDSVLETNSRTNALVAFCMIDNLDELTFAYRISKSTGQLDASKYDTTFTFQRAAFEEKYGDLSVLAEKLDLLQAILTGK